MGGTLRRAVAGKGVVTKVVGVGDGTLEAGEGTGVASRGGGVVGVVGERRESKESGRGVRGGDGASASGLRNSANTGSGSSGGSSGHVGEGLGRSQASKGEDEGGGVHLDDDSRRSRFDGRSECGVKEEKVGSESVLK